MTSFEESGSACDYHFAGAGKMISTGKGAEREVDDCQLFRFACCPPDRILEAPPLAVAEQQLEVSRAPLVVPVLVDAAKSLEAER